jgi:hypothetical protein
LRNLTAANRTTIAEIKKLATISMTTRITTIFTLLILSVTTARGQKFEPLELAKKIFGKDSLTNIGEYITGEYKGEPNGKSFPKDLTTVFSLLGQTDKKAVVAMTILDSSGKGLDTYLHFEKDTVWKMNAFRVLAMTGIIEQVKIELEKMTRQQVDDIIASSKKKKKDDFSIFTSREDYNFQLGNAKLILELDDNISKHFLTNQAEFERIKNLALNELEGKNDTAEGSLKLLENSKPDYRKLFISSVSFGDYEVCSKCLSFLIGGILDNTVGYLFIKDKKDLPQMDPDGIIMIKEIGGGWYIYKTT